MLLYLFCNKSHYENVPFEIPESWCWTTLGELCSIKGGKRLPKGKSFADTITPHIYIRVTDMKDHTVLLSSLKYIDEDVFAEIKNYTISSNDLYLTIAGTIGDVGLVPAELDGANLTENAAKLTDIKCSKLYLMYVLMSSIAQDHFCSRFHQVAQPKLSLETASSTLIPLPPYREQLRIAEGLDRWLGVVVSVEDDLSELTNYVRKTKSKILDLAISGKLVPQDPNDEPAIELLKRINPDFEPCDNSHYENMAIPQSWELVSLNSVVDIISGVSYAKSDIKESGVRILRGGNIQDGEIICLEDDVFIDQSYSNMVNSVVKGDIVLVASTGSPTLIGKTGYARITYPDTQIGAFLRIIRPKSSEISAFLNLIFNSDFYKNYIRSLAKGTNINNVKNGYIEQFEIALPPIQEQERIVMMVENIFISLDNITAGLL